MKDDTKGKNNKRLIHLTVEKCKTSLHPQKPRAKSYEDVQAQHQAPSAVEFCVFPIIAPSAWNLSSQTHTTSFQEAGRQAARTHFSWPLRSAGRCRGKGSRGEGDPGQPGGGGRKMMNLGEGMLA